MDDFKYLSEYYDRFVGADYDLILKFLQKQIKRYNPQANYGVDLGCGSGTLTIALSDLGFDMIGVDASEGMLMQATQKVSSDSKILFLQQDLTELDLYGAADFMISTLDCLNYLPTAKDVENFISRCSLFLNDNGLLIFDFNTLYKYQTILNNNNFVYEDGETFCIWENEFDGQNIYYDLTYFRKEGELYKRLEDHQQQTYYAFDDIAAYLDRYGFEVLSVNDDYTDQPVCDTTERIVITAQRRRN